eukprot:CAMPEP_0179199272 /NCGR_PEP_ID=MMETSP0796-20121207/99137_1 /TAXON_ID=73915 /ORGANISM="Pyrodinium bahamense, Strain pbaha01" /LENGTH=56 /DNA_ID=CAMNT_0020903763 /DNA_START=66 /DNA_END=232 /DNA_ORIENTATION=-
MKYKHECNHWDGRIDLQAATLEACGPACAAHGVAGCCEWQTDWESCFIIPGAGVTT